MSISSRISIAKWIDFAASATLASFFAIPTLRAALGISQVVYLVAIGFLVGLAIVNLCFGRVRVPGIPTRLFVLLSLLLLGWMLLSSFWTPANIGNVEDVQLILGLVLIAVFAPLVLTDRVLRLFIGLTVSIGFAVATYIYYNYIIAGDIRGFGVEISEFYLTVSQALGVSAVAATLYGLQTSQWRWWMIVVPYIFVALAFSLARGALLSAMIITLIAGVWTSLQKPVLRSSLADYLKSNIKRTSGIVASVGIVGGILVAAMMVERTAIRLRRMFEGGGAPTDTRGPIWIKVWESIQEAPIWGYGLSSSSFITGRSHPHNMFLQVWTDGGIFPVAVLTMVCFMPFFILIVYYNKIKSSSYIWVPYIGLLTFIILEYSKSYNFYTSRVLFILIPLSLYAIKTAIDKR